MKLDLRTRLRRPRRAHQQHQVGAPPGTLASPPDALPTTIWLIDYSSEELVEQEVESIAELKQHVEGESVTWLNVVGLGDAGRIAELGQLLELTDLVLEDVLNVGQRPKFEDHEEFGYFVSRLLRESDTLDVEQVSIVFDERFVVSFHERPDDSFELVRQRIRSGRKRIRSNGTDYLVYALVDALIDSYYPITKTIRERLEELEDNLIEDQRAEVIGPIHAIRRELRLLRGILEPSTEAVHRMLNPELELISNETRVYLADCWDHARRLQDAIQAQHELGGDLVELQMSLMSNRLNEVMKVLTIFAALFIPLTFIAGIYGMNFDPDASRWNMPELGWAYGYPAALASMVVVAGGLMVYFVRKGWIGGRGQKDEQSR